MWSLCSGKMTAVLGHYEWPGECRREEGAVLASAAFGCVAKACSGARPLVAPVPLKPAHPAAFLLLQSGSKRGQPPASATPQPPKRSKQEAAAAGKQKAPATAPPKVASAPTPSGGNGEYLAALKSYLSTHGPTKLATLGSVVKRPPKVPKLKHFLEQNKGVFKYNVGTDAVSLA